MKQPLTFGSLFSCQAIVDIHMISYNETRRLGVVPQPSLSTTLAVKEQSIMADSSIVTRRRIVKGRKDRNSSRVAEMYSVYADGASLMDVAQQFGLTRQAVYDLFKTRELPLRAKSYRPSVEFNGAKYTLRNTGYYGKTTGKRTLLHRDVWEFHNDPIPVGYDIHHIDEDKTNNDIDNLECLPKSEHTRLYSPHNNQYTRGRKRQK